MTRYILVNHFTQTYFDLGVNFPLPPPHYWHGHPEIIRDLIDQILPQKTNLQRAAIYDKLMNWLAHSMADYLEVLDSHSPEYDYVVSDFLYTLSTSRYELIPATINRRSTPITYDFPLPTPAELAMCPPAGATAYSRRTRYPRTVAFYVLKKGLSKPL